MSKIAVETLFGAQPSYQRGVAPYTASALGLGLAMMQQTGSGVNAWAGPIPPAVIRPFEYTTATIATMPWAMTWPSTSTDWIFFGDNLTTAPTRKIMYATLNRASGVFGIQGIIVVTFPIGTNVTVRGFEMEYFLINTGSVSIPSGSITVTGSGTQWASQGACAGNRIGFGSTIPSQIGQWYEITSSFPVTSSLGFPVSSSISNSFLALTTGVQQTYSASSYVIEDLRAVMATSNATVTNGGVFVVKGLRPEIFNYNGTGNAAIPAAGTIDNARACYWLADSYGGNNSASLGFGYDPTTSSFVSNSLWTIDTVASPVLFNYNTRRPLYLIAGKDTGSCVLRTGGMGPPSGTPTQMANAVVAKMASGPGSGSACLYFTTSTKVYRTIQMNTVVSASTNWIADVMSEIPPGSVNTFAASSLMQCIDYSPEIDKLIIGVNATTTPFRSYITQYRTDVGPMDRVWGIDTRQIDESTADATLPAAPSYTGTNWVPYDNNGLVYLGSTNTGAGSATLTREYVLPLSADWEYAATTGQRIITPAINTPNCNYYQRLYVNTVGRVGGSTLTNLGLSCEDWRAYYRTAGISNDSGTWTLLDHTGDLSGVAGATQIQFMFEFRTIGTTHIPDRITSCVVVYQDTATDIHYQPSVAFTNLTNKTFAWRFASAWGGTVPTLKVTIYDAVTGGVYLTDNTATPTGTWQKSINNGATFGGYDTNDYVNTGSYITYVPASLGDNIKVQANLTQY